MEIDVTVPDLGEEVSEGTISFWHKKEGDDVEKGEELVEIETDDGSITMKSRVTGILSQIIAEEGGVVSPGDVIAVVEEE